MRLCNRTRENPFQEDYARVQKPLLKICRQKIYFRETVILIKKKTYFLSRIIYLKVICWTLGSPLIHPLKSGIIALERPLVNPFQGWGCRGCQDLLRWKNLIFSLSDQHIPGDRLHLVMSRWKSKWAKVLMVTHRLIKWSSLSVLWLCAIE